MASRELADPVTPTAAYRRAIAETIEVVLRAGRFRDGDCVINYCAGAGIDSLAIARRVAPRGAVHAVDNDPARLAGLAGLSAKHGLSELVYRHLRDAMTPLHPPRKATHLTCLFGLHHLPDPGLATDRWALAGDSAARLLTADWGQVRDLDAPAAGDHPLPVVSGRWRLATAATVEFHLPATAPAARGTRAAGTTATVLASVVVRDWTRSVS